MKWLCILVVLLLGLTPVHATEAQDLVKRLKAGAEVGGGISSNEDKLAKEVQAAGALAIPYLLPLLRDKDEDVRALAAYTLRNMEGLTDQHLDPMIEYCRREEGWIPPAIARVGSPKAVTFLVQELVRKRSSETQLQFAVQALGEKAVPQLLQAYLEELNWDDQFERTISDVFRSLREQARTAIEPLLKIANNEALDPKSRVRAIRLLHSIGPPAEPAVADFKRLRQHTDKDISHAASYAIIGIGSAEAAPFLEQWLKQADKPSERENFIGLIGSLEKNGVSAGPTVATYITDPDWDLRLLATQTVGRIGYTGALDALIPLLTQPEDWRLALCATRALGQLKSERALPALALCAKNHWYFPVRESAQEAITAIKTGTSPELKPEFQMFNFEQTGHQNETLEVTEAIRFPIDDSQHQLLRVGLRGRTGDVEFEQLQGLKVDGGYLVGTDHGEWGGAIYFVNFRSAPVPIAPANTAAIYRTKTGIVAVTGIPHLFNWGSLFKLSQTADGSWTATRWRTLPGAPKFSRLLKDGRILIVSSGSIVLVSPEGEITSLTRNQALK